MNANEMTFQARAERAEEELRRISLAQSVIRAAARETLARCGCKGSGLVSVRRGFYTVECPCLKCTDLRYALSFGEIQQ
jgi:hypothetical protein